MHRGQLAAALLAFLASSSVGFAGTLDDVRARDKLICGVSEGLGGFSKQDATGAWQGFDVDFCRAVAAAVLGDAGKVEYLPLSAEARFAALSDGKIDLLSRNSTWTMSRDLDLGLDFPGTSYFDGQGFMIPAIFGAISPLELDGASICVVSGTTTEANAAAYFEKAGLKVSFLSFEARDAARAAYAEARCDAYTADRSALAAERAALPTPDEHVILKDVISKEPLGPVVRDSDPQWTSLIRWTLFALIDAEEQELDAASMGGAGADTAKAMGAPAVKALGLADDWLVKVLAGVGNYGEVFERNLGEETPMQLSRGVNALWTQGGILYAPPMP
ncbi:amino acid ABC transporter substrate-binding protein [Devosia sp. Root105]|uniref:amino acid ABC transporter substrate-binding protein n=1 Tax=Devosia sp. Root105 TaxID=1736423 RepID=UPI0006F715B2|nr:amino acid ABC transporter substrate-binding protein [Devosia sp. Root105]KQU99236.1 amino acid ABC transporter substrate-binding protein [Devosia sp. Root105]